MRRGTSPRGAWLAGMAAAALCRGSAELALAETPAVWRMKEPMARAYRTAESDARGRFPVEVGYEPGTAHRVEFGRTIFVRASSPIGLESVGERHGLARVRDVDDRTAVFQATSAREAMEIADAMTSEPGMEVVSVSRRRFNARQTREWAAAPSDPYYDRQWQLDPGMGTTGAVATSSAMAFRAAWAMSRAAGVVVGIYDDGTDATHPDLRDGFVGELSRNWFTGATNCAHSTRSQFHGTATAGLAVARGGNGAGISGAAPAARWAGQVIFDASGNLPDTEQLARALGHASGRAWVQNHSWANADLDFLSATPVEQVALSNALHVARGGLGVPMVRSSGNTRMKSAFGTGGVGDANLDAFANHPGAIVVAGLRRDGTVASYSTPGACVLVAAAGGEVSEGSQLFSLDPTGDAGLSTVAHSGPEMSDYVSGSRMPAGTSFSAPQVTGLVALCLDLRPRLSVQDVQRLLAVSSRPLDLSDPDLATNAAGLVVSHNVGHGTPDPGLLMRWAGLPRFEGASEPRVVVRTTRSPNLDIPDDGLRVTTVGTTPSLSFGASGGTGLHPDGGNGAMPWVDGDTGESVPTAHGKCLLLRRGTVDYPELVRIASTTGASAVVIINSDPDNDRSVMLGTDRARMPIVTLGNTDGRTLLSTLMAQPSARVGLELRSAVIAFNVSETLSLDGVRVRLRAVHPRMGNLRVTLRSPRGTWSVLQRSGTMTSAQIDEWWYSSRRHVLEPSRGVWTLAITDEAVGSEGRVLEAEIELAGLRLEDTDDDGLDDRWERTRLGSMDESGPDDPDEDGLSHAVEAWLGTDPRASDLPLRVDVGSEAASSMRIEWPVTPGRGYRLESAHTVEGGWKSVGTAVFTGWHGTWRAPTTPDAGFFRVVAE